MRKLKIYHFYTLFVTQLNHMGIRLDDDSNSIFVLLFSVFTYRNVPSFNVYKKIGRYRYLDANI